MERDWKTKLHVHLCMYSCAPAPLALSGYPLDYRCNFRIVCCLTGARVEDVSEQLGRFISVYFHVHQGAMKSLVSLNFRINSTPR